MKSRHVRHALTAALLAGAAWSQTLSAQTIGVNVGDSARVVVSPGSKVAVPINIDLSKAGTANFASFQGNLNWGTTRLTFDSIKVNAATGFSLNSNTASVGAGAMSFNVFNATKLTASGALSTAYFTASATTGGTRISLVPIAAGDETAGDILAKLLVRNLNVCVAPSGKWGDVNDDAVVNILDAQQIARFSVGLSVANSTVLGARGDVNADNTVNILDAQQIARSSVGLSAAARINTALYTTPTVSSVSVTPSTSATVSLGQTLALTGTARDSTNTELSGCAPLTWTTSDTTIAKVSSEGVVTGIAAGTATIAATAGGKSASVSVTVQPPYQLAVTTQPTGSVSNTFLAVQPVVTLRNTSGATVTTVPTAVTASILSGTGTLSGTTTVTTVNGIATFTDLAVTGTGAYTLQFTAAGLPAVSASSLTMTAPTSMRVLVGAAPSAAGTNGTDLVIPLQADLTGRGTTNLASISLSVTWDPTKFTYVSSTAGTWVDSNGDPASVTVNTGSTATGTFTIGGFTNAATLTSFTLRTLTLRPIAAGTATVTATVTAAGSEAGANVTVTARNLTVKTP